MSYYIESPRTISGTRGMLDELLLNAFRQEWSLWLSKLCVLLGFCPRMGSDGLGFHWPQCTASYELCMYVCGAYCCRCPPAPP